MRTFGIVEVAAGVGEFLAAPGVHARRRSARRRWRRVSSIGRRSRRTAGTVARPTPTSTRPPAHVVEERHALGEAERMGEGQVHDGRPDAHAARARGEVPGEEDASPRGSTGRSAARTHTSSKPSASARLRTCQLLATARAGSAPGGLERRGSAEAHGARALGRSRGGRKCARACAPRVGLDL